MRWADRLTKIIPWLACPKCRGDLIDHGDHFVCGRCNAAYPIKNGKIYFIDLAEHTDPLDNIKTWLKRILGPYYQSIRLLVGPTYPFSLGRAVKRYIDPSFNIVVDLGCGNHRSDPNIITLDSSDYDVVDLVADLSGLPFKDGSIDAFCSASVLEHIPDIDQALKAIQRCTKPDGLSIHYTPFMYPLHASPHDYRRFTHAGAARLFMGWPVLEQRAESGPFTLFLICFTEFAAALLSAGNGKLKAPIYLMLCVLTFPLKFLDVMFVGRKLFLGLAPTMLTVFRKP